MKLTYSDIVAMTNHEGLHLPQAHTYVGSFKEVPEFSTKNREGNTIAGYAAMFPAVHVQDNVVVVDVHTVVFSSRDTFYNFLDSTTETVDDWNHVEAMLRDNQNILHRSVKRAIPLSRWMANTFQSWDGSCSGYGAPNGTAIQRAVDSISRHLNFEGYDFDYLWLTGNDLVEKYRLFQSSSPSCMTGGRCEQVRLWSTNGNQCRLLVIKDGTHEVARTLCFRPGETVDKIKENLPFGPGWFYGRVYDVDSGSSIARGMRVSQAIAWMRQKGLLEVGLKNCPGPVPLIITELSPYIDRGYVFADDHEEGETCYWTIETDPKWLPSSAFNAIESNQYGSGFGRGHDDDGDFTCSCCDNRGYEDDMTYVQDYGDVCGDCLNGGNFTFCLNDEWHSTDDTYSVYYDNLDEPIGFIASESATVRIWWDGGRKEFTRAVNEDGNTVYASRDLVHDVLGSDEPYAGDTDSMVLVQTKLEMNDDGSLSVVRLSEEQYCRIDHSVLFDNDGDVVSAFAPWYIPGKTVKATPSTPVFLLNGECVLDGRTLRPRKVIKTIIYVDSDNIIRMKINNNYYLQDPSLEVGSRWRGTVPHVVMTSRSVTLDGGIWIQLIEAGYSFIQEFPDGVRNSFKFGCVLDGYGNIHPFTNFVSNPQIGHYSRGPLVEIEYKDVLLICRTVIHVDFCSDFAFVGESDHKVTHLVLRSRSDFNRYAPITPVLIPINSPIYFGGADRSTGLARIKAISARINQLHTAGEFDMYRMTDEVISRIASVVNETDNN